MNNTGSYTRDYYKYQYDVLTKKLEDLLVNEELSLNKENIMNMAFELLDLVDDNNQNLFNLDSNYRFDEKSVMLIEEATKHLILQFETFKDMIDPEHIELMKQAIVLLRNVIKGEPIIKPEGTVNFITIPSENGSSVLEDDVQGYGPHGYEFRLTQPSNAVGKSNAELLLGELEQIENVLRNDPVVVRHTGKGQSFQSEGNIQVKRNTNAAVRIPLMQYNGNSVIIAGIFHKVGQNDPTVQKEYEVRRSMIDAMKKDLNTDVEECKKLYYKFKLELIKKIYGSKLDGTRAIYTYLLEQAMKKQMEVSDEFEL